MIYYPSRAEGCVMLPVIRGKDRITFLEKGFVIIRQKGSHVRMKSDDGRIPPFQSTLVRIFQKGFYEKLFGKILK